MTILVAHGCLVGGGGQGDDTVKTSTTGHASTCSAAAREFVCE